MAEKETDFSVQLPAKWTENFHPTFVSHHPSWGGLFGNAVSYVSHL